LFGRGRVLKQGRHKPKMLQGGKIKQLVAAVKAGRYTTKHAEL